MAELADAADSKSAEVHPSWGFDPPSRHHPNVPCTLRFPTLAFVRLLCRYRRLLFETIFFRTILIHLLTYYFRATDQLNLPLEMQSGFALTSITGARRACGSARRAGCSGDFLVAAWC